MTERSRHLLGWTVAVLAATFVSGTVVGTLVSGSDGPPPVSDPGQMANVVEQLPLDSAQRAAVDDILRRRGAETDSIMLHVFEGLRTVVDSTASEIRAVLTADQQVVFDSLIATERSQIRMRRPAPPGASRGSPTRRR